VAVGRGVAVGVTLAVGEGIWVTVAEGVAVAGIGVSPPQAARKTTKDVRSKSMYFIEAQLYSQAV